MTSTLASERLPRSRLFAYAVAELPISMAAMPVALFLPAFYTQDLGLGLATVGFILMLARLWDVVTDPLIGYLGDRTRSRFGRRKPWIAVSLPIMMIAVYQLFIPSGEVTSGYLLGWIMLLWIGWTLFNIPYFAWGAELSTDYAERTRITGWRTVLGIAGTVVAVLIPAGSEWLTGFGGRSGEAMLLVGIAALILMPFLISAPLLAVPERNNFVPARLPIFAGLKIMWANPSFRRLVFAFVFSSLAVALCAPLFVLFINHVIGDPTAAPKVVLGYYVASMLGVPFWMWLANRTDKHVSWLSSLVMMAVCFPCFMLVGEGDLLLAAALLFVVGIAGGNFQVVPSSMKADVIDVDRLSSGEDRAGVFFAAWSTATKLVHALGVGISMPLLELFGFDPTVTNGPNETAALQTYFSFAPVVFYALAALLLWRYPVTRARHREIRAEIEAARAGG